MIFRTFGSAFCCTAASLGLAFVYGGWTAVALSVILGILEVSLSFDNAIVNAKLVERLSEFWQKVFLTAGIAVAVFGVRLLFPLLVVGATTGLSPAGAVQLAMAKGDPEAPGTYGYILDRAHPQIAAFGGMFLFMLFLDFVLEDREIAWLRWLERPLAWAGKLDHLAVVASVSTLLLAAELLAERPYLVLVSGALGIITYLFVNALGSLFEAGSLVTVVGKAAFFLFLYLEVLDASFSFDGVVGAFAVTADPIIIAIGLGLVGAVYVRSLTVFLVRRGTLHEYVYLEHGAHWAIGALAVILLCSVKYSVPEILTGFIGIAFIGAALISSTTRRRRSASSEEAVERRGSPVLQGSPGGIGAQQQRKHR